MAYLFVFVVDASWFVCVTLVPEQHHCLFFDVSEQVQSRSGEHHRAGFFGIPEIRTCIIVQGVNLTVLFVTFPVDRLGGASPPYPTGTIASSLTISHVQQPNKHACLRLNT